MSFPLPKGKPEFSKLEESILQYWKENDTFKKSVETRPAENPYRFYDGPPFITGNPHYGTLLSSIIKDTIPRYQTMLGKRVERVWGWDCHGLPIEQKVQKKLGLESNKEIEESEGGIQGFIDECYAYTRDTSAEWSWYIDHIGRWVDMEHAYRTMDQDYMESVMWVFSQIWEKGYVYEGKRVSWYSWKLSTPISNFEIAMDDSYQDVQDPAVTIKFPILDVKKGAGIIVQDEEGKLLMIRNKKDGLWRIPGGNIEPSESYHDGAARELLEETGITCELSPYCSTYIGYRGDFYEALTFRGAVPVGTKVTLEKDKYTEYEYFALDALPLHSEIHRMEYDLIDFLTGVREPVIVQNPRVNIAGTPGLKVNILAWTTTPWTLPMHMALAVNKDLQYVAVYHDEEIFIVAASRVETVFKGKGEYQVLCTIPGEELVGLKYQAPFSYYQNNKEEIINNKEGLENCFKVYHADFVTDTDGTGIAHEAPEFGDVDFQLAKQEGIFITSAIDEAGKYTAEVPDYQGQLYLDCIDPITERLKTEGTLFKKEGITHRVPYCPRSNTPLIQKAQKSWFIDIQRIKSELIAQNENINWFPDHFKHGRFLKSLESAPDWCISRSRFWGTPMPVWQNADGSERVVINSREELYQRNKPLGQITKIIFVRHGESEGNLNGFIANSDTPLTEKGKNQADELGERLQNEKIEIVISSPYVRTEQTAQNITNHIGLPIIFDERIKECNLGIFEGKKKDDSWLVAESRSFNDTSYRIEGGESIEDMVIRGQAFIQDLIKNFPGKTVLVVSHNNFGRALFSYLKDQNPASLPRFQNSVPAILYLDNNTGKEINLHRPNIDRIYLPGTSPLTPLPRGRGEGDGGVGVRFSGASHRILGIHGYNHHGNVVDFFEKTKEVLEKEGVHMDAPFFESGESVDYKNWEKVFDGLDIASYDTWITHSMGAKMARQYIVSRGLHIKKMILVGPRYEASTRTALAKVEQEQFTHTFEELRNYVDEIIVINSEDDTMVPCVSGKKVAEVTGAKLITINGSGHFNVEYSPFITGIILHGAPLRRIPEVLDVWMDSASMPYAQVHYPFENQEKMEASFPADFIAEYTGQIRAWFYVMHAIGVMVKGSPAFKNVAVTGVINGTDGRKMSKSFGNYPDPRETIEKYGADAIRFYLMSGTLMKGEDMTFSEAGIQESIKRVLLPLWNAYTFFATYANIDGWHLTPSPSPSCGKDGAGKGEGKGMGVGVRCNELDTWIISRLHTLILDVRNSMDVYDLQKTCEAIMVFLDGLNNWYIRRNRRRFWKNGLDADKCSAYETLHEVLVTLCQLLAPICPFITEYLYKCLVEVGVKVESRREKGEELLLNNPQLSTLYFPPSTDFSVHLTDYPLPNLALINLAVNQKMFDLQALTNLGLAIRGREKLRVRQPLRAATITLDLDESARETLAEELNVKEIHCVKDVSEYVTITYSPDAKKIGATERKQWMKTIISDAKAGKGELQSNGDLMIKISNSDVEIKNLGIKEKEVVLTPDEFETVYTPKEGSSIAFAGNAGYVIGLDTTLDEALTLEGYARDLVRGIQDARKELGFEVTDRLQLSLISENEILAQILGTHQGMIEKETLTTACIDLTLALSSQERGLTTKAIELDEGFVIVLSLNR